MIISRHDLYTVPDLHVFACGSLIWNPGFDFDHKQRGLLRGYHRRFCVRSMHYRGTPENPGLVIGLDHGGSCHGVMFHVTGGQRIRDAVDYLWEREMDNTDNLYAPRMLPVETHHGGRVKALAFVVNRGREDGYFQTRCEDTTAAIIRRAQGKRGSNIDYLLNTVQHLDDLGVADHHLRRLAKKVRP